MNKIRFSKLGIRFARMFFPNTLLHCVSQPPPTNGIN